MAWGLNGMYKIWVCTRHCSTCILGYLPQGKQSHCLVHSGQSLPPSTPKPHPVNPDPAAFRMHSHPPPDSVRGTAGQWDAGCAWACRLCKGSAKASMPPHGAVSIGGCGMRFA